MLHVRGFFASRLAYIVPVAQPRHPRTLPAAVVVVVDVMVWLSVVAKTSQVNLLEMSNAEVEDFLIGMGEPKFRAKQVSHGGKISHCLAVLAWFAPGLPRRVCSYRNPYSRHSARSVAQQRQAARARAIIRTGSEFLSRLSSFFCIKYYFLFISRCVLAYLVDNEHGFLSFRRGMRVAVAVAGGRVTCLRSAVCRRSTNRCHAPRRGFTPMKPPPPPVHTHVQVLKWIFEGGAGSFEDMTNIPKALRVKLAKVATVGVLEVISSGG